MKTSAQGAPLPMKPHAVDLRPVVIHLPLLFAFSDDPAKYLKQVEATHEIPVRLG